MGIKVAEDGRPTRLARTGHVVLGRDAGDEVLCRPAILRTVEWLGV